MQVAATFIKSGLPWFSCLKWGFGRKTGADHGRDGEGGGQGGQPGDQRQKTGNLESHARQRRNKEKQASSEPQTQKNVPSWPCGVLELGGSVRGDGIHGRQHRGGESGQSVEFHAGGTSRKQENSHDPGDQH